jgi:hypothetical protein
MFSVLHWLRSLVCAVALVVVGLSAGPVGAQSTVQDLYAITSDKKLLRLDLDTGAGTLVATLNVVGSPYGLASLKLPHGESAGLWTVTTSNLLYRVDPYSGRVLVTNVLAGPTTGSGGLAWRHFLSDRAFIAQTLNSTGTLIRLDYSTGTLVVVGALSPPMEGLDINDQGTIFGLSAGSSPGLYFINATNAATTLIGSLGLSGPGFESGALAMYGGLPGEMYAALGSASESHLHLIDAIGTAHLVGPIGFPRVAGMAFHVRQPGPLTIKRIGTNIIVSWPQTNGGYLWRRTSINSPGLPTFNSTFPATNQFEMFHLSAHPPF